MEISFTHTQVVHLHVNKTNFHMKGFAPGLALKQRKKGNSEIACYSGLQNSVYILPLVLIQLSAV